MEKKRYRVRLNSTEKIEELLQEIYEQACKQLNEIQDEMNKLINSTNLAETTIDEKSKYSKAMHDFIGDKNKAISSKFEIAKFMGEIIKHNGNIGDTLNDSDYAKRTKLDLAALRAEISNGSDDDSENITLKS